MSVKRVVTVLCVFLVAGVIGVSYARMVEPRVGRVADEECVFDPAFVSPLTCAEYHRDPSSGAVVPGEYLGVDVGIVSCEYGDEIEEGVFKELYVNLTNAYPGYSIICDFTVENIEEITANFTGVLIEDPDGVLTWSPVWGALIDSHGRPVLFLEFDPDPVGLILEPGEVVGISLDVSVGDAVVQGGSYGFRVTLVFEGDETG
jgi:hypothetical protein